MSKQIYILNEGEYTTFRSCRGASNIDITAISNQLLNTVVEWEISEQESCSDHNIIRYATGQTADYRTAINKQELRYIVKKNNKDNFQWNPTRSAQKLCEIIKEVETETMDKTLFMRVTKEIDIEKSVEEFHEVVVSTCRESFRTRQASKKANSNKTVPWLTEELTIMRKSMNALRRIYQRTRNHGELRESRSKYIEGKAMYADTIKKEKITSWKEYCNMTSYTNPWNEVYKLAAGRRKNSTQITTLQKSNGTLTADIRETLKHMLD
jgi:hypothetical protein